nr:unnamed protein product [Digitaria exilis]
MKIQRLLIIFNLPPAPAATTSRTAPAAAAAVAAHANRLEFNAPATSTTLLGIHHRPAPAALPRRLRSTAVTPKPPNPEP